MTDKSWKATERRIAADLGVQRQPSNGRRQLDIDAGPWGIEAKKRKSIPGWLVEAMAQAVGGCAEGQTPIVILTHAPGRGVRHTDYVLMRYADWFAWQGELRRMEE